MMDRNYPCSSFADALAPPAQSAASWAYERSSATVKPSTSYGTTHVDTEVLHRQSYVSSHQLPNYTTTNLPAGGTLDTNSHTSETSIMSFLSAMESRSLQAGPVGASLLPPFRPPSWPSGTNSTTELYLTGALPSTATFPSTAALMSYQHTSAYPTRSCAANSPPALQDPAFSTSTSGLFLSHHDPLLHLKPSQTMLPAALAFSTPTLGSSLPVQSSTYRSAQESAPHLLQPQFSLLPCPLSTPHGPTQQFGTTVFSGSIERALQRECSVIKHHQRPSTNITASEQSPDSEHTLQGYFSAVNEGEVSYPPEPSRHSPVSCNLSTGSDSSHGVVSQTKTNSVTEAYSAISVPKAKDIHLNDVDKDSNYNNHNSPGQKQNSIANQQSTQLSAAITTNSPIYVNSHAQSQPPCSSPNKLPAPSSQSGSVSSVNQSHVYSPGQEHETQYTAQAQGLCQELALSESYAASHSQGTPLMTYTSQSEVQASLTYPHSYAPGQSLNSSFPTTCMESLPTSNSSQVYSLIQASGEKVHNNLSAQEAHSNKSLPLYSLSLQSLQNNITTSVQDIKPSTQQVSMSVNLVDNSLSAHNNIIYVVSKMEDHQKLQSVIRSSSQSGDQANGQGPANTAHVKDESTVAVGQQHAHQTTVSGQLGSSISPTGNSVVCSPAQLNLEQKLHTSQIRSPESHQQNHQNPIQGLVTAGHTQFITVPCNQVLIDPNQIISHNQSSSKGVSVPGIQQPQGLGPVHVQYLHMDRDLLGSSMAETTNEQGQYHEQSTRCSDSNHPLIPKSHYDQATNQQLNDAKNHFALNSICFSDSVLDERNIMSNVDDILAATVAACGVQDFVKASSSVEADRSKVNSADPKNQFQTLDMRHISPIFSNAQELTNVSSSTVAMASNGSRVTSGCQGPSIHFNHNPEHHTNEDKDRSENHFTYVPSGNENQTKGRSILCMKTEECSVEYADGEVKKKGKFLTKPGGDDEAHAKRSGQAKRQNSRPSDISPPVTANAVDSCPQQERIRQKIREVEEKQPEVKNGFIGSFLDFLKSGPKQQYSPSPMRTVSRSKKPSNPPKPLTCTTSTLPSVAPKLQTLTAPLIPQASPVVTTHSKRLDEDLQRNLETLPSFSSDEEENTGKNLALRNSISSVLSSLDESSDRKIRIDNRISNPMLKPEQPVMVPVTITAICLPQMPAPSQQIKSAMRQTAVVAEKPSVTAPSQLAVQLMSVALEGLTDDELSDSGGEGMYRERDEFVVRNEDIEMLKVTMKAGNEPPAIWKVQKALLQKFVPELRDGRRVFSATNSYLGYFGDAKTMYRRVYVKFLDTVNKREYVRVCSRKPRCKPMTSLRGVQVKALLGLTANTCTTTLCQKPRPKQPKSRAEPPPKKRRKWKEEFSSTHSDSSAEEDDLNPPVPFTSRLLNTRTMKETFKGFVELLISIALDEELITALERSNDDLLLPHMKKVDGMITDNRKRLLHKLPIENILKTALDSFPEIAVVTEMKKEGETPTFKIRLSGRAYNKKTMKPYKLPNKVPQEYTVNQQQTQWFSLYHSLQHYKYHTYLMCKNEIESLRVQAGELGQEQTVQKCLQNGVWLEGLFDRFGELINQVQQVCR
ncbi:glutamine and serine-rich protein 1 [Periophthalmus magnuspinnatus]|uniref:glutamine and serine-rich protein 1 n=1 Tax=Periophthalmus magnuspinnatus TaxID=409849 RepID=UPI00145BF1A2|nr:glutamine and serine-rich protein 1 [Periophthalmus magnuspinnatus]